MFYDRKKKNILKTVGKFSIEDNDNHIYKLECDSHLSNFDETIQNICSQISNYPDHMDMSNYQSKPYKELNQVKHYIMKNSINYPLVLSSSLNSKNLFKRNRFTFDAKTTKNNNQNTKNVLIEQYKIINNKNYLIKLLMDNSNFVISINNLEGEEQFQIKIPPEKC